MNFLIVAIFSRTIYKLELLWADYLFHICWIWETRALTWGSTNTVTVFRIHSSLQLILHHG